jgi:IS5 family transposase
MMPCEFASFSTLNHQNLASFEMKPKQNPQKSHQMDLFRPELIKIINPGHEMVKLANVVDWDRMDELFGETYCPDNGRPGISTRLMVSLHYLKYTFSLSDEDTVAAWIENPYWQHLGGMKFFEHEAPIDPSSMTNWRKRIGKAGAEERGIPLRQNYNRNAKKLILKQSRYAHALQMRRAGRCTSKLKTYLGRVIRDIERKQPIPDDKPASLLHIATRVHQRTRNEKNKIYRVHAPGVECISKGKVHKRYEFGCEVSVAATSRGGVAAHGNPYDGHTLADTLDQVNRIAKEPLQVFVDRGYRGHDYTGNAKVHVDKPRRGRTARRLWRWMKRRAAIEPAIGHLKREHRMDRNRLCGQF